MQSHSDHLDTLSEISRVLSSTLDLPTLYETIYQQIARVMDATLFSIAILEPGRQFVSIPYLRENGRLGGGERVPFGNSITSLVIKRGIPLRFDGNNDYCRYAEAEGVPPIIVGEDDGQAVLFAPMSTGSRTIGALSVESARMGAYSEQDLEVLSVIAGQAAIAIENARLYTASRESMRQMQALLNVAQTLNRSLDLRTTLESILTSIRDVLPYAYAAVLLPDHVERVLDIMGSIGALERTTQVVEDRSTTVKIPFGQGITGQAFVRGTPLVVPDVREFPNFVDHGMPGVFSELAMPLRGGRPGGTGVIGVLDVGREGVDAFSPDDLNLLSLFASQAAIAVENARLFSEQRERAEELQVVQSIIQAITPLHDVHAIARSIAIQLKRLVEYSECRIFAVDEGDPDQSAGRLPPAGTRLVPLYEHPAAAPELRVGQGFVGWVAEKGQADVIANILEDPRVVFLTGDAPREASMIGVPLIAEGRVRGVLTLAKPGRAQFDENSLRLLEIVGGQAALAFDRAELYDRLRVDAITDALVGLPNRRYLLQRYREEHAAALRNGRPLACLILDIDRFKAINDRYGHDAGDAVLRELGGLLRAHCRTEDVLARYGGEEFCVLLVDSSPEVARRTAERLRGAVEKHRLSAAAGIATMTVSIGVASLLPGDDGAEMFSRADHAMYRAKAAGGNCVRGEGD